MEDRGSDQAYNEGIDDAIMRLCHVLGVDAQSFSWDAATETVSGDIDAVLVRILDLKFGEGWRP